MDDDDLDDALFRAWVSGDQDARNRAWESLWTVLYSTAVRFCRRFCGDDSTAEGLASGAFLRTVQEIDRRVRRGFVEWRGKRPFVSLVRARLIKRCRDELRREWNRDRHEIPREIKEDGEEVNRKGIGSPSHEEALIEAEIVLERAQAAHVRLRERIDRRLATLHQQVRRLAACREMCRKKPALCEVLTVMESYLQQRLAAAERDRPRLDAEAMDEDGREAWMRNLGSREQMYQVAMQSLGLDPKNPDDRNVFDQRLKRIRRLCPGCLDREWT